MYKKKQDIDITKFSMETLEFGLTRDISDGTRTQIEEEIKKRNNKRR